MEICFTRNADLKSSKQERSLKFKLPSDFVGDITLWLCCLPVTGHCSASMTFKDSGTYPSQTLRFNTGQFTFAENTFIFLTSIVKTLLLQPSGTGTKVIKF